MAHCRDGGRPSWRPVIEVLRANRLPMVEAVISSITRRRGDWVRWRPVFEQVLPWRSLNSAAGIDPLRSAPGKLAKNRRCKSPTGQGLANHPDPE